MSFLRGAALLAQFRTVQPPAILPTPPARPAQPETPLYVDGRTEAAATCRALGLDVTNEHWDTAGIADFIRLAYAQGWSACERRLDAPDMADGIYQAIHDPESILPRQNVSETVARWTVRAVQQVVAYGVPKR
jgi:hypothetical protein